MRQLGSAGGRVPSRIRWPVIIVTVGALIVFGCSPDDQTATTTTRRQTISSTRPTTPPSTTPPQGFITRDIVEANGIITCSSPELVSAAERGYTRTEIEATFEEFSTSLANPASGAEVFISFARLRSGDYIELALVDPGLIPLVFDTYQIPGSLDMYCLQATPTLVEET